MATVQNHDFREHKKALFCRVRLFLHDLGVPSLRPCLLKSSWTSVTFQSLLFCGSWWLPPLCFSQWHSHLPESPSLSVHPFIQPAPRWGLHVFYVEGHMMSSSRTGTGPRWDWSLWKEQDLSFTSSETLGKLLILARLQFCSRIWWN